MAETEDDETDTGGDDEDAPSGPGPLIREVREKRGMPRRTLARRLGVATNTLWRYETGRTQPDIETVKKAAKELNVPVDRLFGTQLELQVGRHSGERPLPRGGPVFLRLNLDDLRERAIDTLLDASSWSKVDLNRVSALANEILALPAVRAAQDYIAKHRTHLDLLDGLVVSGAVPDEDEDKKIVALERGLKRAALDLLLTIAQSTQNEPLHDKDWGGLDYEEALRSDPSGPPVYLLKAADSILEARRDGLEVPDEVHDWATSYLEASEKWRISKMKPWQMP